jgi:alanine racemase
VTAPGEPAGSDVRPTWLEVDLDALRRNYSLLLQRLPPTTSVIGSLKANAYGHGATEIARTLDALGIPSVATGSFRDALAIRAAGVECKILLFGGYLPGAAEELVRHDLIATVYNLGMAEALSRSASSECQVYVKVDCGLGRLGVPVGEALAFVDQLRRLPHLVLAGLYTHLPFSDAKGEAWARRGLGRFSELLVRLRQKGIEVAVTQALSSPGVLAELPHDCTAVCTGRLLYGLAPFADNREVDWRFRPVLRAVKTRLIHVQTHASSVRIGSGGRYQVKAGGRTGVVPAGQSDGYRGSRKGTAEVLHKGRRIPVIGVSLEHTTLDLTASESPAVGDEVVLLGSDQGEQITLAELAAWQGVSELDVLMAFSGRVDYRYLDGQTTGEAG